VRAGLRGGAQARHDALRSPWPGGALPVELPPGTPSRAHAKIEQAIAWAGLPIAAGQVAVEIGSAPGGAAYALCRRGVSVWGVDPAGMDPAVLAFVGPEGARVHHVAQSLAQVRWESLPRHVDWLLCDVHVAPPVALHGLARLRPAFGRSLRGAVVTLKMNDEAMRRGLPQWIDRLRALGLPRVEVAHLPANRHELCAVALA
jgi:23S rRNA (cytidine2498-2'-O)-methyltransferase